MTGRNDGCFRAIVMSISPHVKSRTFSMALPHGPSCRRSNTRIRQEKIDIEYTLICFGIVLLYGASIVECPWEIYRTSSVMRLWLRRAFTSRLVQTTGERHICGRDCRTVSQGRRLETCWLCTLYYTADGSSGRRNLFNNLLSGYH